MILMSGRVIPNWILQLAFTEFDRNTTMAEVIEDIEGIAQDGLNKTSHSKLSVEDALEIFKKFNSIQPEYEDMLDEFFEKHGLGDDEYNGDDDDDNSNDNDNDMPDSPEDRVLHPARYKK